MSTFLEDLQKLGGELSSHELPSATELSGVVGAIIKVLDGQGAEVTDELFPKPPEEEQPAQPAAGTVPVSGNQGTSPATESRLSKLEDTLGQILERLSGGQHSEG